jgi:hypothetical protein
MSTFPDGLYQFGGSPVGPAASVIAAGGKWLWVDPVNGSDSNDGKSPKTAMASVITAEDHLTANKNQGIFMIGGATADVLTATLTWDKSYTHLIGLVAPVQYGIRNRIQSTTATLLPMVTISGNGCVFENIMFTHEGSNATTCARAVDMTGDRNYFGNCTFRQIGASAVTDASKRDIYINSDNGENYFYKCSFGSTSYDGSADAANFNMEFAASAQSGGNVFEKCQWLGSGSAGASWIKCGANSLTSWTLFQDCLFYNNAMGGMNSMTSGLLLAGNTNGQLIFKGTSYLGCDALDSADRGLVYGDDAQLGATTGKLVPLTY